MLQTRDMTIRERKKVLTFSLEDIKDNRLLGHGIGVSGGAMSGRVVFTLEEIDKWRKRDQDSKLILTRGDIVPDDIKEIYAADGLLTARGGVTSHAAVVAYSLGKTGVVGCGNLICNEKEKFCQINDMHFKSGDYISINSLPESDIYTVSIWFKVQTGTWGGALIGFGENNESNIYMANGVGGKDAIGFNEKISL